MISAYFYIKKEITVLLGGDDRMCMKKTKPVPFASTEEQGMCLAAGKFIRQCYSQLCEFHSGITYRG